MSEEFMSEEQRPIDIMKETSSMTYHNISRFTELSKDHFLDDLLKSPNCQLAHVSHQKQRSKVNSKNYRERKKGQVEQMRKQVEALKEQNEYLRTQKYCRWCNRPFDHPVLVEKESFVTIEPEKGHVLFDKTKTFNFEQQFQKPELNLNKKEERRGKIWMALGLLMLVLGLTIHGFDGDGKTVKEIQLQKEQVDIWVKQMNSMENEYIQVNMGIKEKQYSKMDPGQMKIIYKTEAERGKDSYEDQISFNKELLLGIQAQIDDVGFYL